MERHDIPPVYDGASRVLILGSFPSVRSREEAFFYAHPQNRFWRVLAAVLGEETPQGIGEKRAMLLRRHIALWDAVARCTVSGSSDASIRNAAPNDVGAILAAAEIRAIFCNGAAAYGFYEKLLREKLGREAKRLPSTSPANAAWSFGRLTEAWRAALAPYLE